MRSPSTVPHIVAAGLLVAAVAFLGACSCGTGESREIVPAAIDPAQQPRIERVENGLLPVNPLKGRKGWNLEDRMREYMVPGLSVAVIQDFQVVWAKGYGVAEVDTGREVTPDTLFQAASLSKPVVAAAVLSLAQQGDIDLDENIQDYLSSWELQGTALGRREVTARRLLSHTAGVTVRGFSGTPYDYEDEVPTLLQVLDGEKPAENDAIRVDAPPGKGFQYSGGGYVILQQAMEDLTGRPFPDLMRSLVLDPAGMSHSTFEQPLPERWEGQEAWGYRGNGALVGGRYNVYTAMAAAGLWTTPTDLGRFIVELQRGLRGDDGPVLDAASVREMMKPEADGDYALGLGIKPAKPAPYFMHSGANEGYRALLVGQEQDGYGAVVMANSDIASELLQEVVRSIAHEYGWEGFLPEPMEAKPLSPEAAEALPGRYQIGSDEVLIVRVEDGKVTGRVTLGRPFRMIPIGGGRFGREDSRTTYTLTDDGLMIQEGKKKQTAMRLEGSWRAPSEFVEAGDLDAAVAAYEKLREERPQDMATAERRLNLLGYEAMGQGDLDLAIRIFKVNTRLYPDSANTYDSLAEAYWNAGDRESAFRCYRTVLEKLPGDEVAAPRMKDYLRSLAEEKLALASGPQ